MSCREKIIQLASFLGAVIVFEAERRDETDLANQRVGVYQLDLPTRLLQFDNT